MIGGFRCPVGLDARWDEGGGGDARWVEGGRDAQ